MLPPLVVIYFLLSLLLSVFLAVNFVINQGAPAAYNYYLRMFTIVVIFALLALEKLANTVRLPGQAWVEGEEHLSIYIAWLLSRLFIFC